MKIFIVPGYGTPENIFKNRKYNIYLRKVWKYIQTEKSNSDEKILIIFSGGHTDMKPPYKRTEAGEMIRLFKKISFKKQPKYEYKLENKSLSSLENQLYSSEIIKKRKLADARLFMFCEKSRVERLKLTALKIFNDIKIVPVEIPLTGVQIKNTDLIKEKEKILSNYSLRALNNKKTFLRLRKLFIKKFKILRNTPKNEREKEIIKMYRKFVDSEKI